MHSLNTLSFGRLCYHVGICIYSLGLTWYSTLLTVPTHNHEKMYTPLQMYAGLWKTHRLSVKYQHQCIFD